MSGALHNIISGTVGASFASISFDRDFFIGNKRMRSYRPGVRPMDHVIFDSIRLLDVPYPATIVLTTDGLSDNLARMPLRDDVVGKYELFDATDVPLLDFMKYMSTRSYEVDRLVEEGVPGSLNRFPLSIINVLGCKLNRNNVRTIRVLDDPFVYGLEVVLKDNGRIVIPSKIDDSMTVFKVDISRNTNV